MQVRPAETEIRKVSLNPLINAEIEREMRENNRSRLEVERAREQLDREIERNTRNLNKEFLPRPPYLGNEPIMRALVPRPQPQPPVETMSGKSAVESFKECALILISHGQLDG